MTGDGRVGDLEGVVLHAPDGRTLDHQLVGQTLEGFSVDNELSHDGNGWSALWVDRFGASQTVSRTAERVYERETRVLNSSNNRAESCGPGEASG
jgi:hypothetical protein